MAKSIRAVYESGHLRLLDPVELKEGQQVEVTIFPELVLSDPSLEEIDARLRSAGLLVEIETPPDAVELTPEERERIGRLFSGTRPSEVLIDEDRGQY